IFESYKKAPFYSKVNTILEETFFSGEQFLSEIAKASVILTSQYLGISINFVQSSSIYKNSFIKGQDRILDICLNEGAEEYWNLPGGKELYSKDKFNQNKIALNFVEPKLRSYPQFSKTFNSGLSVIDVMMHNSPDDIKEMLK
ncbi:MAG: WbqC family protein, partial [Candidatus Woesearchaeota archaeon]